MELEQPTAAQIAQHYSAAMDSVNLINGAKPETMSDAEWDALCEAAFPRA